MHPRPKEGQEDGAADIVCISPPQPRAVGGVESKGNDQFSLTHIKKSALKGVFLSVRTSFTKGTIQTYGRTSHLREVQRASSFRSV